MKIPRDAARPKLEDLIDWYDEIPGLPFQPEEEDLLQKIIDNAQTFRNHVAAYCNPVLSTRNEAETQRFYLRKIEGAEVLLANETNFFRQELHKWSPVAPEAPPLVEVSKSTRKPRPTKLDRLLQMHGVEDVEDLPEAVKSKGLSLKRKRQNAEMAAQAAHHAAAGPTSGGGQTSPGIPGYSTFYQRGTSSQPQTPGLSAASSTHAHPSRGPGSSSSSTHHGHPFGRAGSSGPMLRPDPMDLDPAAGNMHSGFFIPGTTVPQLVGDGRPGQTFDDRLLPGQSDDGSAFKEFMLTEAEHQKAMEMLSKSKDGRDKGKEFLSGGAFGGASGPGAQDDGVDDGNIDQMFADMVNQDDDDEKGKGIASKPPGGEEKITAESLESERNGMDALLDGE